MDNTEEMVVEEIIKKKTITIPCRFNGKIEREAIIFVMPENIDEFDSVDIPNDVNAIAWNESLDGILYHDNGAMFDDVLVWVPDGYCRENCSVLFSTRGKEWKRFQKALQLAKDLPRLR